ncbi:MAG: hypothetical protein L0226_03200 [Acidobacteria bacterium]|nr:hypothetical protein [Acidobacteriota bacterium]
MAHIPPALADNYALLKPAAAAVTDRQRRKRSGEVVIADVDAFAAALLAAGIEFDGSGNMQIGQEELERLAPLLTGFRQTEITVSEPGEGGEENDQ